MPRGADTLVSSWTSRIHFPQSSAGRLQRGLVFAVGDQLHALLEIAALRLFLFYRFEEGLEIALAKGLATSPLYQFEKESRSVLERFGKDLEHVSLLILVDQNAEFLEVVYALGDSSDSLRKFCVV